MLAAREADRNRLADLQVQILDLQSDSLPALLIQVEPQSGSLSTYQSEIPPNLILVFGPLTTDCVGVEAQILGLRHAMQLVQERLDAYKYPVLNLPNEIVSEIFVHFLPIYPLCPPLYGPFSPTLLTHICHDWREIALATPALWRAISLTLDRALRIPPARISDISDMLRRSGSCPLSIRMDEPEDGFGFVQPHLQLVPLIIPHRERWEFLKLRIVNSRLSGIEGRLPLLRQVDLQFNEEPSDFVTFLDAPLLRTVTLDDIAVSTVILPWMQLTSLTLRFAILGECATTLQQTPNLVRCKLELFGDVDGDSPAPDVVLLCLEELAFVNLDDDPIADPLGPFTLPALRTLQIPDLYLQPQPVDFLGSFISKSGCKLQDVCITSRGSVAGDLYREAFPSIPNFSFIG